jgi:2-polyprenyl-3-methyl-5-hydroxy-6-metoxy-1,4-benzoquinol methylase
VSTRRFTGERLHAGDALFGVDLARHRAAYEFARPRLRGRRVVELGCGSGYGTASLAGAADLLVGVDRVAPDPASRVPGARYLRADLHHLSLREQSFDAALSFQVIEHLEDPQLLVRAMAQCLRPDGFALVSTPNVQMSDGVNPYHVREYDADALADCLRQGFAEVEILGVGMSDAVRGYMAARSTRIRRIMRLDPLRLRERLPRAWIHALFAAFALLVRRRTAAHEGTPDASIADFPIAAARDDAIDWLALCRRPRSR